MTEATEVAFCTCPVKPMHLPGSGTYGKDDHQNDPDKYGDSIDTFDNIITVSLHLDVVLAEPHLLYYR